jgi:hypothetical protein
MSLFIILPRSAITRAKRLFPGQSYFGHIQTQADQSLARVCPERGPQEKPASNPPDIDPLTHLTG